MRILVAILFMAIAVVCNGHPMTLSDQALLKTADMRKDWYNRNWRYRVPCVVNNATNSNTLTNYPVRVSVAFQTGMNVDFSDVLFTATDGKTLVNQWKEPLVTNSTAYFWMVNPTLAGSAKYTNYLYYGNPSAVVGGSYTNLFSLGSDFTSTGWNGLTTNVGGAGRIQLLSGSSDINSQGFRTFWSGSQSPVISGAMVSYGMVRDLAILKDTNNYAVKESNNYIGYFSARTGLTNGYDVLRATSTDLDTWTNFTTVLAHGQDGTDNYSSGVGTVIKFGATNYVMWYEAQTTNTGHYYIASANSTNGTTWVKNGTLLTGSSIEGGSGTELSVPDVTCLMDGTYALFLEGQKADSIWRIYGFSSTNGTSWTAYNAGSPVITNGLTGTWYTNGIANPKLLQVGSTNFLMMLNGSDSASFGNWRTAFAACNSLNGTWVMDTESPMLGRQTGNIYGSEAACWVLDSTGTNRVYFTQEYTGNSTTAALYRRHPKYSGGAWGYSSNTTTADLVQRDASTNAFLASVTFWHGERRTIDDAMVMMGLYDSAAPYVPASVGTQRRFEVNQVGFGRGGSAIATGTIYVRYWDTGGNQNVMVSTSSDSARPMTFEIRDDGTNYVGRVIYADTNTEITKQSIAKTSVKAFSSGRQLIFGDPFTDAWCDEWLATDFIVRTPNYPEPVTSLGSAQQLW